MNIAITSISPRHSIGDAQIKAVQSWVDHGLKVYSFNCSEEIEELQGKYPNVTFIDPDRTAQGLYKRPYIFISSFIDHAIKEGFEAVMLINSDIVINGSVDQLFKDSEGGLVFANRYDHNGDFQNPTRYKNGFDVFIIHSKYYGVIPQSLFAMGQTWWDYWVPFRFIRSGVRIKLVTDCLFLHARHAVQYDSAEWIRMTEHFQWIEQHMLKMRPQDVNNRVFMEIMGKCK
jgi:hypothetical protein